MSDISNSSDAVHVRDEGRAGLLTLNNPKALNALTHDMFGAIHAAYLKWATTPRIYGVVLDAVPGRAFCAGGDIRAMVENIKTNVEAVEQFFRDEYQHNWTLECFTKPNVALINGIVMGGGVGASMYGTHRVAGENLSFAMPETGIGFFPDVGAGYFLPRCPGETGMYLGLTGATIGRADAFYMGFATHCIESSAFESIRNAVIEGEPIDPFLEALHQDPGTGDLARRRKIIDRIFSATSVEDILNRLESERGEQEEWARDTAALLRKRCPLSLKVTFRLLREGRSKESLKDDLITEFRLTSRFLRGSTLPEGVRAALIDKDHAPSWQPETLADVTPAMVEAYFAPLGEKELQLEDHWKMVV